MRSLVTEGTTGDFETWWNRPILESIEAWRVWLQFQDLKKQAYEKAKRDHQTRARTRIR